MCRYDLLRAGSALARFVSKWTPLQDKMLHRLVSYINSSLDRKMFGWIGDARADLKITLYADADFAGDTETMRSTSRVFVALTGPNSFYPICPQQAPELRLAFDSGSRACCGGFSDPNRRTSSIGSLVSFVA